MSVSSTDVDECYKPFVRRRRSPEGDTSDEGSDHAVRRWKRSVGKHRVVHWNKGRHDVYTKSIFTATYKVNSG